MQGNLEFNPQESSQPHKRTSLELAQSIREKREKGIQLDSEELALIQEQQETNEDNPYKKH